METASDLRAWGGPLPYKTQTERIIMSQDETVKVIWDGARKFGVATGPGMAQFFEPGLNDVPKKVWDLLTKGKGSKDPGGVNHHLKPGPDGKSMLRLASEDVQAHKSIADMAAPGAVEVVLECYDEDHLEVLSNQEHGREKGPRKTVLTAIKERAEQFAALNKTDEGPE